MTKKAVIFTHEEGKEQTDLVGVILNTLGYELEVLRFPKLIDAKDTITSPADVMLTHAKDFDPILGYFDKNTPDLVFYEANLGFPNKSNLDVLKLVWNYKPANIDGVHQGLSMDERKMTIGDLARTIENTDSMSPKFKNDGKTVWIAYTGNTDMFIDMNQNAAYESKIVKRDRQVIGDPMKLMSLLQYV